MASPIDLADALTRAAAEINDTSTLPETLDTIVRVARDSMPDIDHVGITLSRPDGQLETAAATDDFVLELDRIQYGVHEGPCVTALESKDDPMTVVEHAKHESRWHQFIPPAVQRGLRAQMGLRLSSGEETMGVLNMYSSTSETIGPETRQMARLFGVHVAYALGHLQQRKNLKIALESRETIGQAIGLVMARYDLDTNRAFDYLVRVSASSETKLRVVAEQLVAEADETARETR